MKYQMLPPLRSEERTALEADIRARGVLVAVEKDENGDILDGHNRAEIADGLGIGYPVIVREFGSEQEKVEHVLKVNLARRHLDAVGWGRTFLKLLEAKGVGAKQGARNDIATSDTVSEVAAEVGVDDRTARRRMAVARKYESLPPKEKAKVDSGEKTVHKAHRETVREQEKKRRVAAPKANVRWQIINADWREGFALIEANSVRLAFMDPPYNDGFDYGGGRKEDLLPDEDYLAGVRECVRQVRDRLTSDGTFWVLINDEYAAEYAMILKEEGFTRRNWIKWYETFGNNCSGKFNRTSRHLFYCVKDATRFVWDGEAVSRPSDRQTKYADPRANPDGKLWDDVWQISRLTGTSRERIQQFPTQLPLALLMPIIGATSEQGDLVLDPFSGSGTTGAAAISLGRRYIGIEKSQEFARLATERLQGESDGLPL